MILTVNLFIGITEPFWDCIKYFFLYGNGFDPCFVRPRDVTRLNIMAYLDPASNPESKPQMFSDKNAKSWENQQEKLLNLWEKERYKSIICEKMYCMLYPTK